MSHNVEIKAKVKDLNKVRAKVFEIADQGPITIDQEDTFYKCQNGLLKLRKFSNAEGELIYYERENKGGPRSCHYLISRISEPRKIEEILSNALAVRGTVKKRRILYTVGQTRIHFDDVHGLGEFVEFEYVLSAGQSEVEGIQHIESLMERLGISKGDLIDRSYVDILLGITV